MEEGTARTQLEPETSERFVALRRQLGVSTFGLNQITMAPGERGRIHRHERQEEVYLVLAGVLTVMIEGEEHDLATGELMRVAPPVRRQLVNRGPERVIVLALGGEREHHGRDAEAFLSWEAETGAPPQEVPPPPDLEPHERRS
ncbi:MAG TPA: cupin domain-containing protein [Solirubrobacteraceae bacterium]|nr:cupin domain-containing protein [Solirubrobacteraceae bacterium]